MSIIDWNEVVQILIDLAYLLQVALFMFLVWSFIRALIRYLNRNKTSS